VDELAHNDQVRLLKNMSDHWVPAKRRILGGKRGFTLTGQGRARIRKYHEAAGKGRLF
jgi:hypothetical protein